VDASPSQEQLEAAHCWENDDRASRPETTEFRRRLRYHQAQWREAHGHPIGSQPIRPKPGGSARPVGSRIPLDYAMETGANFLTPDALAAATTRLAAKEAHQTFDQQRLWADLLWSAAVTFNLFGDLAADVALADRAVHTWWPDVPGAVRDVRFEHSPGRFDLSYLGSLSTFSAAFVSDVDDGTQSVVAIETKYHDRIKREVPKPIRLERYLEVTERSGIFRPGAIDAVNGTELTVMWLDHLLLLSMLQHPSRAWSWGRLVVVHPAGNTDYADGCARYRDLLEDQSTFASMTLEAILDSEALPAETTAALRERYLVA
jgi:hypothetical protein